MIHNHISWLAVSISFFIAILLELMTLPYMVSFLRPEWVVVVLLYWLIRHPEKIGIATGACIGFFMDIISGSYFGINMLSVSLISYLVLMMHKRLKMFPITQQSIFVFFIVAIQLMVVYTLKSTIGNSDASMSYLWQAFSSALVWPVILILSDRLVFALR